MIHRRGGLIPTTLGTVGVGFVDKKLAHLSLPVEDRSAVLSHLARWSGTPPLVDATSPLAKKIINYYRGKRIDFSSIPLALDDVTSFARAVYEATRSVPWGSAVTYGAIAAMIGHPQSARAVGRALGANRIPLVIPCHRVVAANGALTGFSAPGGIATKRAMLILEGGAPRR